MSAYLIDGAYLRSCRGHVVNGENSRIRATPHDLASWGACQKGCFSRLLEQVLEFYWKAAKIMRKLPFVKPF